MLSLTVVGVAQKTDGGANAIMQELDTKYKGFTTMKINYTYKAEKEKKILSALSGVALIKGDQYYITFDDQVFYCDGTTMWNYQKSTNEVSIYDYEESDDDALNPAKMLATWSKEYLRKRQHHLHLLFRHFHHQHCHGRQHLQVQQVEVPGS